MNEEMNGLEEILSALEAVADHAENKGVIDNLCNVLGIIMMRAGVTEMRFTHDELTELAIFYNGGGMEFKNEGTDYIIKISVSGTDLPQGARILN